MEGETPRTVRKGLEANEEPTRHHSLRVGQGSARGKRGAGASTVTAEGPQTWSLASRCEEHTELETAEGRKEQRQSRDDTTEEILLTSCRRPNWDNLDPSRRSPLVCKMEPATFPLTCVEALCELRGIMELTLCWTHLLFETNGE